MAFQVQLAHPFKPDKVTYPCIVQAKFDGFRAIYVDGQFLSRYGKPLTGPVSAPETLSQYTGLVFDGELVMGGGVTGTFQDALSATRVGHPELEYHIFDCIARREWDTGRFTDSYDIRVRRLGSLSLASKYISDVPWSYISREDKLHAAHRAQCKAGYEGVMVKNPNAPYHLGKSYAWMKLKPYKEMDVTIFGTYTGKGKYKGMLGGYWCRTSVGKEFKMGGGLTDEHRAGTPLPDGSVIEITYQELTNEGKPRFARLYRHRPDKEN